MSSHALYFDTKKWTNTTTPFEDKNAFLKNSDGGYSRAFVQKKEIAPGSEVCFIGDIHGSAHSLLRNVWHLVALGKIKDNFQVANKKTFYMVFNGDFIDRGHYGSEVLYTLFRLKEANPENVFLLRGNHEDPSVANRYGFLNKEAKAELLSGSIDNKFGDGAEFFKKKIKTAFELLPMALYLGCNSSWVQCCHGGIETGYSPKSFLKTDKVFEMIPQKVSKEIKQLEAHAIGVNPEQESDAKELLEGVLEKQGEKNLEGYPTSYGFYPKQNNYSGFNWSDFEQVVTDEVKLGELKKFNTYLTKNKIKEKDLNFPYAESMGHIYSCARGLGAGYLADVYATQAFLDFHGLKAIFRGHQDREHGFKMLYTPERAGSYSNEPLDWIIVVEREESQRFERKGFKIGNHFPVFTFTTAVESQGVYYDTFGIVKTAKNYEDWVLTPYQMFLYQKRAKKYVWPSLPIGQDVIWEGLGGKDAPVFWYSKKPLEYNFLKFVFSDIALGLSLQKYRESIDRSIDRIEKNQEDLKNYKGLKFKSELSKVHYNNLLKQSSGKVINDTIIPKDYINYVSKVVKKLDKYIDTCNSKIKSLGTQKSKASPLQKALSMLKEKLKQLGKKLAASMS